MPATKNAPESGQGLEGDDRNPLKGTIMNDATSVPSTTDIHPEIPRAPWVTHRYLDDDDRVLVDEHQYEDDGYEITRDVTRSLNDDGTHTTHAENVLLKWSNVWSTGGTDDESVTILTSELPALIGVLQRIQAEVTA